MHDDTIWAFFSHACFQIGLICSRVRSNANLNGLCIQPYQFPRLLPARESSMRRTFSPCPSSAQRPSPGIKRSRSSLGLLPLYEWIETIRDSIEKMDRPLPDSLYHLFLFGNDSTGQEVHHSRRHAACISRHAIETSTHARFCSFQLTRSRWLVLTQHSSMLQYASEDTEWEEEAMMPFGVYEAK